MKTNMNIGDAHGGRGRRGCGRGGGGRGCFQTEHWRFADGQGLSTDGQGGGGGSSGRGGRGQSGGSVDSRQYALPSAPGLSASSMGTSTSISMGATAAFSTGAVSACADVAAATGALPNAATATSAGATIVTGVGATVASGVLANAAAISTGATTTSAAVIIGVPVLPPLRGRGALDHPLNTEQGISMTAAPVASIAASTSVGTASAPGEFDLLSLRAQMIILMDRNSSSVSNESLSGSYVKSMYDAVMRQRDAIIAEVVKEKPELQILITDALDAPFNVQNCQHPGKGHRVEKLVDIWEYYEQVPTLSAGFIGRSRATSLRSYTDTMCRYCVTTQEKSDRG
jgi:hypothetical protein